MKLQAASMKEIRRMARCSLICMAVQLAGFVFLHAPGLIRFDCRVVLSTVGGTIVANAGFISLCKAVERAVDTADEKLRRSRMQLSYNLRLLMQAGWVILAFLVPCFHVLAAAVPLLYPAVILSCLRFRGRAEDPGRRKNPASGEEEQTGDRLEHFEI